MCKLWHSGKHMYRNINYMICYIELKFLGLAVYKREPCCSLIVSVEVVIPRPLLFANLNRKVSNSKYLSFVTSSVNNKPIFSII